MDIRSALTDDYLTGFFDVATMARARSCVDRVRSLEIAQLTSGSLTATAQVWGTAPAPYHVQLHMEVDEASDWVFSACSCPVGRLCKHGAALAMVLRSGHLELPGARSAWQQRLDRLSREVATRAQASLEGVPLALEVSRRPANRWSRSAAGELALRPLRPGARRGWVKSGAEWTDLSQPVARGRFVPATPTRCARCTGG